MPQSNMNSISKLCETKKNEMQHKMNFDSIIRNPKPKIDDNFVAICNLDSLIDFLVRHEWIRAKRKPIYNLQRFFIIEYSFGTVNFGWIWCEMIAVQWLITETSYPVSMDMMAKQKLTSHRYKLKNKLNEVTATTEHVSNWWHCIRSFFFRRYYTDAYWMSSNTVRPLIWTQN